MSRHGSPAFRIGPAHFPGNHSPFQRPKAPPGSLGRPGAAFAKGSQAKKRGGYSPTARYRPPGGRMSRRSPACLSGKRAVSGRQDARVAISAVSRCTRWTVGQPSGSGPDGPSAISWMMPRIVSTPSPVWEEKGIIVIWSA